MLVGCTVVVKPSEARDHSLRGFRPLGALKIHVFFAEFWQIFMMYWAKNNGFSVLGKKQCSASASGDRQIAGVGHPCCGVHPERGDPWGLTIKRGPSMWPVHSVDSQAGVPPGVYNMVMGDGPNCGEAMVMAKGRVRIWGRDIFSSTWLGQTMMIADLFTQNQRYTIEELAKRL